MSIVLLDWSGNTSYPCTSAFKTLRSPKEKKHSIDLSKLQLFLDNEMQLIHMILVPNIMFLVILCRISISLLRVLH